VAARSGDKLYAIKILSKKAILQSKQVDHIYSELLILHQTEHPNIVRFHGYCQNSTHLYYQMELIRGMNVFEYLQVKPFTLNHSLFYAVQIVNALDYLH
jgi:serine/threonine protein kinase